MNNPNCLTYIYALRLFRDKIKKFIKTFLKFEICRFEIFPAQAFMYAHLSVLEFTLAISVYIMTSERTLHGETVGFNIIFPS